MAEGATIILGVTIAIVAAILCVIWLIDQLADKPGDFYEPDPAPETTEQRFRKAHGEDGQ